MLDTASLTGESVPRSVEVGDEVLSGVVNLNDVIYIEVTKPYADSTVSRIIDLVENSASKKLKLKNLLPVLQSLYTNCCGTCCFIINCSDDYFTKSKFL